MLFRSCAQDDQFGLVDADGVPRPGTEVMYRVQSLLNQTKLIGYEKNEELVRFKFLNNQKTEILISWSWKDKEVLGGPVQVSVMSNSRKFGFNIF